MRSRDRNAASVTAPVSESARTRAAAIRRKAGQAMGYGRGTRLTLILSVVFLLTLAVGIYALSEGVYMAGYLFVGDAPWLNILAYAVMGLLALTLALPLAASVYRQACLAVLGSGFASPAENLPVAQARPEPVGFFYPFTSGRAYIRCLAVGLETLAWLTLMVGLPVAGFRSLEGLVAYLENGGMAGGLGDLLTLGAGILCLAFGVLMLFLSGWRSGFAYLAFVHEDLPLGEVNRYFKGFRRSFVRPFVLRISMTGWMLLSVAAVLVPLVLHTIPWGLCCGAMYGAELERKG